MKPIKKIIYEEKKTLNCLTLIAIIGGIALFVLGVIIGLIIASI